MSHDIDAFLRKLSLISSTPSRTVLQSCSFGDKQLEIDLEEVICPICLDFPHNSVLLQCSSYDKGCRSFICDTDGTHSNCLDRFKTAYGMSNVSDCSLATNGIPESEAIKPGSEGFPACPLCRGEVTGWVVIDEARMHLNMKKRSCQEKQCLYAGNYIELQKHIKLKHPHACPSKVDPAQQVDWDNFQQSSEIVDVLSLIHTEVPHGVVLGDYVIEYGDVETGDQHEDYTHKKGNWWTSCIMCKAFGKKASRDRQRSRTSEARRSSRRSSSTSSSHGEAYRTSMAIADYGYDEMDDEFVGRFHGTSSWERRIDRYRVSRSHINRR